MARPQPQIIGNATLYSADCFKVAPLLDAVDHVITDPPYERVMHDSKNGQKGLVRPDGSHHWTRLDFEPIDEIREKVVELGRLATGWFLAFCTAEGVGRWADAVNASDLKYKRACVWVKPDATPQMNGQGPAMGAEMFICAWAGDGHARWNAGGKRGVYTHLQNPPDRGSYARLKTERHPTEKPRRLMSELIADFTNPGDVVFDPFMGVGTTGVAALMAGRRFIGCETNPMWFEFAKKRIEDAQRQSDFFIEPPPEKLKKPARIL